MADVLVWTGQFTAPNPTGGYVANDIVKVYYDVDNEVVPAVQGSTAGITVYLNDVLQGSGNDIGLGPQSFLLEEYSNALICQSTTLINTGSRRTQTFPYFYITPFPDAPICSVTPVVCDLQVTGVPAITPASSETSADGQLVVTATSSNSPIQYKLGSDFVYNDGSGHQSTGTFGLLLPGVYRIYIRDSKNCQANILLEVGFDNTYSTKYRLEYTDIKGFNTRIDIVERAYSGEITEVCGTDNPFEINLRAETEVDPFYPILPTECVLRILSETNFQFSDIYTNDPNRLRILYYKDFGSGYSLRTTHRVQPFQYGEAYVGVPYPVEVVASDGLVDIEKYTFARDDGEKFKGTVKAIELIAYILKKTGLSLNIRVAINLYADGMNTTDGDDPLDQAYVDYQTYYLAEDEPTMEFVLRAILSAFKARIYQFNNVWNIIRVQELVTNADYREFDPDGQYSSNSSYDIIKDVVGSQGNFVRYDHQMALTNGYGKVKLRYHLGLKTNILYGCDFQLKSDYNSEYNVYEYKIDTSGFQIVTPAYPLISSFEQIDEKNVALVISGSTDSTGESYVLTEPINLKMGVSNSIRIKIRFKIPHPNDGFIYFSVPYQKVRFQVTYGSYYLYANGSWSTTANTLTEYVTSYNKYNDIELIAGPPPGASVGYTFQIKLFHSYVYHGEYASFAALKAVVTAGNPPATPTGKNTEVRISGSTDFLYFYELNSGTNTETVPGVILPDDYNASTNAVYWNNIQSLPIGPTSAFAANMYIDYISMSILDSGREPVDTILRSSNAEPSNSLVLEDDVYHGSYQTLINTALSFNIQIGIIDPLIGPTSLKTYSILSADILYTGYFRDSNGDGYIDWTRDGVAESTTLHAIILSQLAAQYSRSYRRLSGSFSWNDEFSLLTVLRETGDSDRIYIQMGTTLKDKTGELSGQFVELIDISDGGGSDGSGSAPYTSGFSTGFGRGGFN